ncbi:N-acyl homoserine lactonase family protein [Hansschlegelia zhihuaiae]|uniref:N-acyl homoserine lactonase family protein n=1 Tax=Hansschlegelia zhihuaiae TaxID=405005 RepID=A0A4Q0MJI3_9HYPH|nr:N-acyl homoserine lactonase family protein [Hansschlegelia zhihuaiae]RXF73871.1 N-acyl homoserine lactonase family protein [Hansschlegelia zhihuaiae]
MRLHLLSGGRLRMRRDVYYLDAAADETLEMPVVCGLIKHRQGVVLFDTGCHPDASVDAEARWGAAAKYCEPIFEPASAVVGQLDVAGLSAGDVDVVVCSHLHFDHCGCNAFFPRATVICHARELAAARASDAVAMGYHRNDWDVGAPPVTIEGQHDVFGDGRVTLIPVPGHTPGSIAACVALDRDGLFVLASDAAPVSACLARRYAPTNTVDVDDCLASIDEIARLAQAGATVVCGHDDAQWRALRTGAAYYA